MRYEVARALARAGTERAQLLVEGLDLEAATDIAGAEWEPFQLAHLNDDGAFRHENKSRQIGWSWLIAAESVAVCHLQPRTTCLFASINREESSEKIRYAKQVYDALYPSWRVPLVGDNITQLTFANGSRIISLPQRPVRGRAKAWVYLDEFAHYRLDREIYTAALPVTTKGGRIRIGSTALGARGVFWEIGEQRVRAYPGYRRARTPWYATSALLKVGVTLREATRDAPTMDPAAAVERFGNARIAEIFENLPLEDFQQEYCCDYIDETMAYIAWADILASTGSDYDWPLRWLARTPDAAFDAVDELANAVAEGQIRGRLTWGLDIGRRRDLTELVVVEEDRGQLIVRAILSLDRQQFDVQETLCRTLLDSVPSVVRGYIDQTGLGMQLAETLFIKHAYGERAQPQNFTAPSKSLWATHLKTRFQRHRRRESGLGGIVIPDDRDLKYQIHSVRRRVTESNNVVFDVESSERHHADKFWALALACEAAETLVRLDELPIASGVTLGVRRGFDAATGAPLTSFIGDERATDQLTLGASLTPDQFDRLIEYGLTAFLTQTLPLVTPPTTPITPTPTIVDADPTHPEHPEHPEQSEESNAHADPLQPTSAQRTRPARRYDASPRRRPAERDAGPTA